MKKGIDISYWQDNVDLQKAKADCVQFVILREGYRKTIDKKFLENVQKAKDAGLPVAVYHFIYTDGATTVENAQATVANMQRAGLDVASTWVFSDLEYDTWKKNGETCTKEKCSLYTLEYIKALQALGCKKIGVYMNIDYYRNYYTEDIKQNYPIWLADYTGTADYSCSIHQYTSSGLVAGIQGFVDMNYLLDDTMFNTDNNTNNTGGTGNMYDRTKVIKQARAWLGCKEANGTHRQIIDVYNTQNPRPRGYKVQYTDAWCATFVSAVAVKLGYTAIIPTECSCNYMIKGFKNIGCWVENDAYVPKPGDVIFYDWQDNGAGDNVGSSDHVGIVESCDGATIVVIEGNNGNAVARRTLRVNGRYIRGFGVPKYNTQSTGTNTNTGNAGHVTKSVDEVAREVINGLWSTGEERKTRLANAGYDYNAVQSRVNAILSGNSTPKKSVAEVAKDVLAGRYGNGDERKRRLESAGYNYTEVQNAVNRLVSGNGNSNRKSNEQIAREIIAGKWGNNPERKKRIQQAGYDYNAIQNIVNKML